MKMVVTQPLVSQKNYCQRVCAIEVTTERGSNLLNNKITMVTKPQPKEISQQSKRPEKHMAMPLDLPPSPTSSWKNGSIVMI